MAIYRHKGMAAIVGQLQAGESISLDMEDEPTYGRTLTVADVDWALNFCPEHSRHTGRQTTGVYEFQCAVTLRLGKVVSPRLWAMDCQLRQKQRAAKWFDGPASTNGHSGPYGNIQARQALLAYRLSMQNVFNGDAAAFLKYGAGKDAPIPAAPIPAPSPVSGLGTSYIVRTTVPGYYCG